MFIHIQKIFFVQYICMAFSKLFLHLHLVNQKLSWEIGPAYF